MAHPLFCTAAGFARQLAQYQGKTLVNFETYQNYTDHQHTFDMYSFYLERTAALQDHPHGKTSDT
ncbi:hypothetical protein [Delftia sp. PS-11]|uniref:hypothetical protein n=1 Tax=Delftia sp. PS-11 TaxID=2767222 RepID=UPI0024590108|nr:hypothetical protein [Delftia sp. PS-11]KAJ8741697.1 hypothetical protein H9T68_21420 [Delftia sp. PS-11]